MKYTFSIEMDPEAAKALKTAFMHERINTRGYYKAKDHHLSKESIGAVWTLLRRFGIKDYRQFIRAEWEVVRPPADDCVSFPVNLNFELLHEAKAPND